MMKTILVGIGLFGIVAACVSTLFALLALNGWDGYGEPLPGDEIGA